MRKVSSPTMIPVAFEPVTISKLETAHKLFKQTEDASLANDEDITLFQPDGIRKDSLL